MKRIRLNEEFFVYVYFDLGGVPRYVGKGKGDRWQTHLKRSHNKQLNGLIKKSGGNLPVVIVRSRLSESHAAEIEIALIKALGRVDRRTGPLLNHTGGGDGVSGYVHPPDLRSIISITTRKAMARPEVKAATSAAQKKRFEDPEQREWNSISHMGKIHSKETKAKISASNMGRTVTDKTRQKLRDSMANYPDSAKEKISNFHKGKPKSLDHRKKLSVSGSDALMNLPISVRVARARNAAIKRWHTRVRL